MGSPSEGTAQTPCVIGYKVGQNEVVVMTLDRDKADGPDADPHALRKLASLLTDDQHPRSVQLESNLLLTLRAGPVTYWAARNKYYLSFYGYFPRCPPLARFFGWASIAVNLQDRLRGRSPSHPRTRSRTARSQLQRV